MKITALRKPTIAASPAGDGSIRDTASQDVARDPAPRSAARRRRLLWMGAGAAIALLAFAWLIRGWLASNHTVPLERLRIAGVRLRDPRVMRTSRRARGRHQADNSFARHRKSPNSSPGRRSFANCHSSGSSASRIAASARFSR